MHFHKLSMRNGCCECSRRLRHVLVAGSCSCFGLVGLEAPMMVACAGCFLETYESGAREGDGGT